MAKNVDFPIKELFSKMMFGGMFFMSINLGLAFTLYFKMAPMAFWSIVSTCAINILIGIWAALVYFRAQRKDILPAYISTSLFMMFSVFSLISITGLFISLTAPPIPLLWSIGFFIFLCWYITYAALCSRRNILEATNSINFIQNAYITINGTNYLRYKSLRKLDDSVNKYPFKWGQFASSTIPLLVVLAFGMITGSKFLPSQDVGIRIFVAVVAFLITPPFVLMFVHLIYVHYIFPKRVFGVDWKNTYRETE